MNTLLRIDAMTLQNFRGFEKFSIAFDPEFNLLVGQNGSGKTSVIEALRTIGGPFGDRSVLRAQDVRRVVVQHHQVTMLEETQTRVERQMVVDGVKERFVVQPDSPPESKGYTFHSPDLPVLAHYPSDRTWSNSVPDPEDNQLLLRTAPYQKWATPHIHFSQLVTWIRRQTFAALQKGGPQPLVEAVLEAVHACLPETRRIYYDIQDESLVAEFEDGRHLPFQFLSDGYQNILAMVADLAWRAVTLNAHLGKKAVPHAQGIVLIDELDLHLHPSWQRRVIGDLRRTFPNLQFIATTHSPQLIASARPEWVRILDGGPSAHTVRYTAGKDTNSILVEVMRDRERPAEMEERLSLLGRLIDQQKGTEAKRLLLQLEGDLGPDYTDLVEARWLLEELGI